MTDTQKIVLIMTDTQGVNVVGCYGRPDMHTPCLDRLASQGVRFDAAYTASPVCGPARSALFTGTYPHTNGSWGNNMPLGANVRTIGQRLSDAGFHTAYIGKWHLSGTDYFDSGICPPGWSSDYWYDIRRYLDDLSTEERLLWRQGLDTADAVHRHGITEEFTYAHHCSDRAVDFLARHNGDPFFLVVSYDEPHGPFTCPPPYCDMFEGYEYPLGDNAHDSLADKPAHQKEWAESAGLPAERTSLAHPMYFGCNSYVDYEIGRVIEAVDRCAPDALVIFTSDHGTPLAAHRLDSKGPAMYDETTRIPFLVRWPNRAPRGTTSTCPVSHIDLVPTVLAAAGLDVPPFVQGENILGLFEDPTTETERTVFMEFNRYEVDHDGWGGFQPIRCAFDGRYKLTVNLHYTDELYDLQRDPQELNNLIGKPESAERPDALLRRILAWMNETRDPFRGPIWERRPWYAKRKLRWGGKTRPRPDDGYEPRVLLYRTGLPVEKWEYSNN